jgi:hypothetical protein
MFECDSCGERHEVENEPVCNCEYFSTTPLDQCEVCESWTYEDDMDDLGVCPCCQNEGE